MAVNLIDAIKNVFKDKEFLPKYAVLVVLSFCYGLMVFAVLAKNTPLIIPSAILTIISSIFMLGYDFKYIKSLIADRNADMPEWKNPIDIFKIGGKFIVGILLLILLILSVLFIFTIIGFLLMLVSKALGLIYLLMFLFILMGLEMLICVLAQALLFAFIESDFDILSLINFKGFFKHFSINYFITMFITVVLSCFNGFLGTISTYNIKYALLYIIPLMIAPILRMIIDNLLAQTYVANKCNERGSAAAFAGWFGAALIVVFLFIGLCIYLGMLQSMHP